MTAWGAAQVGVRETGYVAVACAMSGCGVWDQFPSALVPDPNFPDRGVMDAIDLKWLTDWADDHRRRYHEPKGGKK